MAQSITITLQDDLEAQELLDNFCYRYSYEENISNPNYNMNEWIPNPDYNDQLPEDPVTNPVIIPDPTYDPNETIPNPETKKQYMKRVIIEWIREEANQGEQMEAYAALRLKYKQMIID